MKRTLIILIAVLVFAACAPASSPEPVLDTVSETEPPATSMLLEEPTAIPPAPVVSGELSILVISPLDEAVLDSPEVDVIGTAPAGTVVSVNDEIVLVGDDGEFKVTLSLEEGPNLIEIVASDINGNEVTHLLTVVFEP